MWMTKCSVAEPVVSTPTSNAPPAHVGKRSAFWLGFWLAVALVAAKAVHLGVPAHFSLHGLSEYQRTLAILAHQDILFAIGLGLLAQLLLWLTHRWPIIQNTSWASLLLLGAVCAFYGVANLVIFDYVGAPMTYPMMRIGGNTSHMASSLAHFFTPGLVMAVIGVP